MIRSSTLLLLGAIAVAGAAPSTSFPEMASGTGDPELDRLLADRPAPEGWNPSDSPAPEYVFPSMGETPPDEEDSAFARRRLEMASRPWLGTRYQSGGNGPGSFDCSGFVKKMLDGFGVRIDGRTSSAYWKQGRAIPREEIRPGDLVFFSSGWQRIGHVGLALDGESFVHASVSSGVTISRFSETYYRKRYKGARRLQSLQAALLLESPADPTP
ncbi:MAG: C40 family peptidase [Fibrobacteria bacterium]|nr:C40 family peptidase [Fibrobacteria bacterium]